MWVINIGLWSIKVVFDDGNPKCFMGQSSLVGGIPSPLKNYEFVSWYYDIPNIWEKYESQLG